MKRPFPAIQIGPPITYEIQCQTCGECWPTLTQTTCPVCDVPGESKR